MHTNLSTFGLHYRRMATFPVAHEMKYKSGEVVSTSGSYTQLSNWLLECSIGASAKQCVKVQNRHLTSASPNPRCQCRTGRSDSSTPDDWHCRRADAGNFPPGMQGVLEDHIALDPWKGIAAHGPLGNIDQLHKVVYEPSQKTRNLLNARRSRRRSSVHTRSLDAISLYSTMIQCEINIINVQAQKLPAFESSRTLPLFHSQQ